MLGTETAVPILTVAGRLVMVEGSIVDADAFYVRENLVVLGAEPVAVTIKEAQSDFHDNFVHFETVCSTNFF